jgi:hypothetical protein
MLKMALLEPFGHLQHKLWMKEGPGVKLTIWLLTIQSRESTRPRCVQVECNTQQLFHLHYPSRRWKAVKESYKFALDLIPIKGLSKELWIPKILGVQARTVSGLLLESPGTKMWFECRCRGQTQKILYMGRWWFPPNPSPGESYESRVVCGLS